MNTVQQQHQQQNNFNFISSSPKNYHQNLVSPVNWQANSNNNSDNSVITITNNNNLNTGSDSGSNSNLSYTTSSFNVFLPTNKQVKSIQVIK